MRILFEFSGEFGPSLLKRFDRLYVIHVPDRHDRLRDLIESFQSVGLQIDHPKVIIFDACCPQTENGFESRGAHGCFRSHLEILKAARDEGLDRVLIAEDDLDFLVLERDAEALLKPLDANNWDFFFAGYHFPERFLPNGTGLVDIGTRYVIGGAHLYAVSARAYDPLISWLDAALVGPLPRPHVDVAISEARATIPGCVTWVASPAIGVQRRSRSDIQVLKFYDRISVLRPIADMLRRIAWRRRS